MSLRLAQFSRLTTSLARTALIVLASVCCTLQLAFAQADIATHPSVVLVLKLVSATHVKPVTGVVLSDNGLVLVPAEFVADLEGSPETELVVLDGGGDIFSHGRPATIRHASLPGGLAVIEVKGLGRPGVTLSEPGYEAECAFHLAAFPPAKAIARGDEPLWLAVQADTDETTGVLAVSTLLPNVSGAIIDACGYMAGLSIASGVQSLETGKSPTVLFYAALSQALESEEISVPVATCSTQIANDIMVADIPAENQADSVKTENDGVQQPSATQPEQLVESNPLEQTGSVVGSASESAGPETNVVKKAVVQRSEGRPSLWRSIPWWVFVNGFIILAFLIYKAVFFIRLQKSTVSSANAGSVQPASDEPETTRLKIENHESGSRPRSGREEAVKPPDLSQLADGFDAFLVLEGMLDPTTPFSRYCAVRKDKLDIIIGRGDADICIEHPVISRRHARLMTAEDTMTVSDLGSSNGTYIGAVPCLAGDIMYIQSTDQIFLGDLGFRIRIISKESNPQ